MKSNNITRNISLSVILCMGLVGSVEAGKIGSGAGLVPQAFPSHSSGFNGWNLDNVDVRITDLDFVQDVTRNFDKTDGSYSTMVVGDSFESRIHDSLDTSGVVMGHLHGKNWPVGEPAGIKVMEANNWDDTMSHSRPASCIMTTSYLEGSYLDAGSPSETLCGSDFQTHKRFKINLLPATYIADDAYGHGVNMTFNVIDDANTWPYMILQKINNYTGKRLSGYKVEVGFLDAGGVFTTASANAAADVKLSIGTGENMGGDIWDVDELAVFSHGLFGPQTFEVPVPHFPQDGFFDNQRAGFVVELNPAEDTIASTGTLGSNYNALPVPHGAVAGQFGPWLTDAWAPYGVFFDEDDDPATDNHLMAFWGDPGDGSYAWMKGDRDNFQEVTAVELSNWAADRLYNVGVIEDVLNLGLNYIVKVGDITTFPAAANDTFTIRITPYFAADQTPPAYVANTPPPLSDAISSAGTVQVSPEPNFAIGDALALIVTDADLNLDANALDTVDVTVTTSLGESETVTLTEIDVDRAVFTQSLPTVSGTEAGTDNDGSINVALGTVVTVTYIDLDDGTTGSVTLTATTSVPSAGEEFPWWLFADGDDDKWYAVNDTVSLLFTIFGFLVIGGLIARRRLV